MDRENQSYLRILILGILLIMTFFIESANLLQNSGTLNSFISGNLILVIWGFLGICLLIWKRVPWVEQYFYFLFAIGAIYAIINLILIQMNNTSSVLFLGVGFYFVLTMAFGALGLIYCGLSIVFIIEWRFIKNHSFWNSNLEHTGIILVHYDWPTNNLSFIGVDTLIKGIYQKEPFKVYNCHDVEEINSAIKNPKVNRLWIFGHGVKHGVSTDSGIFYYCNLLNEPHKDFVAQLHCNCEGGKSSCDYLLNQQSKENCIISDGIRHGIQNEIAVREYVKKLNNKT